MAQGPITVPERHVLVLLVRAPMVALNHGPAREPQRSLPGPLGRLPPDSLWRLDGLAICDLVGRSAFLSPRLTWSATVDIDVSLFAQLFVGDAGSEFGAFEDAYFLRVELFF